MGDFDIYLKKPPTDAERELFDAARHYGYTLQVKQSLHVRGYNAGTQTAASRPTATNDDELRALRDAARVVKDKVIAASKSETDTTRAFWLDKDGFIKGKKLALALKPPGGALTFPSYEEAVAVYSEQQSAAPQR